MSNNENRRHFEELNMKIKLEIQPIIKEASVNPKFGQIMRQINELTKSKVFQQCGHIQEKLVDISSGRQLKLDSDGKIEMTPLQGKDKDFLKLKLSLEECTSEIDKVGGQYVKSLRNIEVFKLQANEFCLNKCYENTKNDSDATACIKDCYSLMLLNTKATIPVVNDQLFKYLSSLTKI
jgi:hypothetical protein